MYLHLTENGISLPGEKSPKSDRFFLYFRKSKTNNRSGTRLNRKASLKQPENYEQKNYYFFYYPFSRRHFL
jgi:hypothetical protein